MADPTYGSAVKILAYTDPAQFAPLKWDVVGYKSGSVVASTTGITDRDKMETTFAKYQKDASQKLIYDQVIVLQYTLNTPS